VHIYGSQEEDFRAAKGNKIKTQMRTRNLYRSGRGSKFVGEA
jgi:hypothetical protein